MQNAPFKRTAEAAEYLGLSASTLAKARCRGDGPPFHKAGKRIVLYSTEDLDDWIAKSRRRSTSEQVAQRMEQSACD